MSTKLLQTGVAIALSLKAMNALQKLIRDYEICGLDTVPIDKHKDIMSSVLKDTLKR